MSFLHRRLSCKIVGLWRRVDVRFYCATAALSADDSFHTKDNFLPQSHPVIVRHKDTNTFYLHPDLVINGRELTFAPDTDLSEGTVRVVTPIRINASESPVRKHLKSQSYELKKMMFFYNETNPHSGLVGNTKQLLYDYFQLVGPVKDSWFRILMCDPELSELLISNVAAEQAKDENLDSTPSIATIASMLDRVASKKGVSNCKYKSTVTDNLFQIQRHNTTRGERAILEVLAQYAYIDYEVIDHSS